MDGSSSNFLFGLNIQFGKFYFLATLTRLMKILVSLVYIFCKILKVIPVEIRKIKNMH